jgi:hypothetical protein
MRSQVKLGEEGKEVDEVTKVSADFRRICSEEVCSLLDLLENGIPHLQRMTEHLTVVWQPEQPSRWHLHNHYVDLLLAVYLAKHAAYSCNLANSLNRFDYLGYALNARSIVESTATLRYYLKEKYFPAFASGSVNLLELIKVDDQHLRGSRFDWERFISKDFQQMADDVLRRITDKNKKTKIKESVKRIHIAQVNVLTCLERWAREAPIVMILYELLCEMVHPNLGSTFLVASKKDGRLSFGRLAGTPAGHNIFETSIGWLLPIGYKEFGNLIGALMVTKYPQDQLDELSHS